jgi:hypothetical protein
MESELRGVLGNGPRDYTTSKTEQLFSSYAVSNFSLSAMIKEL